MVIERIIKESFSVIGKQGSTQDDPLIVARLWADANAHFPEVAALAKQAENGSLAGIWGAMSDFSMSFLPWTADFSEGFYLAGVECSDEAEPPAGWVKWTLPGFEYLRIENSGAGVFSEMIGYMQENKIPLVGAVQDFTEATTGKGYMLFPVRKL